MRIICNLKMKTTGIITLMALLSTFTLQVLGDDVKPEPRYTCECAGGVQPYLLLDLCKCGECAKVDKPMEDYVNTCRIESYLTFEKDLAKECTGIENTEDCEFFKATENKRGGKILTEGFKKCRDVFDSIGDDCEEAEKCCYKLDDRNAPADD